ncbi:hypothetical protein GE061_008315 [Apolygus lucorum]|uniref:non-specific serine/threonine protein kinase n=1 Tax=Apolygus lucorum TaxID=248454 RepID=A0A8S9WPI6_APOLU|nr:hypothetical protein GE061_008315 [Apolygus lucorum]
MKSNRNELIQSAKSKLYYAAKFQKPKQNYGPSSTDMPRGSTLPLFVLTPTESLASINRIDSKQLKPEKRGSVLWPNVKEYYDLLEVIGLGTTAQVCTAFCTLSKEKCAIKIVDLKKWPFGLENLLANVQAMTMINHDNLVTYYTAFVDRDELFLVLRYMEHHSLKSVIKRKMQATNCENGVFDEPTIATIMTGVLSGLEFIHNNGYIHRDMKAENILLGANGLVKIADFATTNCWANARPFVGSPCWLAPEIIEDPTHTYTNKADIWSFGITAIEMATGHPPYHRHPTMKVLMLILLQDRPALETVSEVRDQYKKYGKHFRSLIQNCLQKDVKTRPTATDLLFHTFFKKSRDGNYLHQVLEAIPPDLEQKVQKQPVEMESAFKKGRREWIPEPDDEQNSEIVEEMTNLPDKRGTSGTNDSGTSPSLKIRSSLGKIKLGTLPSVRGFTNSYSFVLKIRGLHLDTPMILKTAIRKERELFDIKFVYLSDRDTPETVASDLVREGLIDPRDRHPVATNLKAMVKAGALTTITFPLVSDVTNTETPCEWRLVGYASLSLTAIRPQSNDSGSPSSYSTLILKTPSHSP